MFLAKCWPNINAIPTLREVYEAGPVVTISDFIYLAKFKVFSISRKAGIMLSLNLSPSDWVIDLERIILLSSITVNSGIGDIMSKNKCIDECSNCLIYQK